MENITNPTPEIPVIFDKPKTNYLNLILISLGFVLFLSGAYYLGRQSTKSVELPKLSDTPNGLLPKTTTVPTQTVNPITNWKTYKNSKYNYSFMYPTNWKIEFEDTYQYTNVIVSNDENKSISAFHFENNPPAEAKDFIKNFKSSNGYITLTFNHCIAGPGTDCGSAISPEDKYIFNQVISTFKFTESNAENIDESRIVDTPLDVATSFLNAYSSGDWVTVKNLCEDKNFDPKIAAAYNVSSWHLVSSKYGADKNYYHVLMDLTTKDGQVHKISPGGTQIELLMHNNNGVWKALTWYFFQ